MLNEEIKCSFTKIPFKSSLSFEFLLDTIERISKDSSSPLQRLAKDAIKRVGAIPAFRTSPVDPALLEDYRDEVNMLMAFVFNPLDNNTVITAAMAPFQPKPFHTSSLFNENLRGEHIRLEMANELGKNKQFLAVIYQAYLIILQKFYNFQFNIDIPFVAKATHEANHSVHYYKILVNPKHTGVKYRGKLKKLSPQELKAMFDRTSDLDFWNEMIPLEKFEFTGFLQFTYVNITHEYVISQLKSDLLDKQAIISNAGFARITEKVRALMGIPDLDFGLAAFSDFESTINQNVIWRSLLPQSEVACESYPGTLYEEAYMNKKVVLTDDMQSRTKDPVVNGFLKQGIKSHAVIPLILDDEIVGMIEFGAKKVGQLNMVQVKRFHELFPVFAIALRRSKEEMNDRIRAIIQEECTAIHPVVEWRFWEAATNMLDALQKGEAAKMENIVFEEVVPVYGATDIRNSSVERNSAIQSDMEEQLNLAKSVLLYAASSREIPLLDHLVFKTDNHLETVRSGLKAGDEVSILEFIQGELEPVFKQLKQRDESILEKVDTYFTSLDEQLGVLYKKRKDFEESLTTINDLVGDLIDAEQVKAQQVFPHYFEKYRTDGVEYNAYMGQSLVRDFSYDPIYLRNIRLWQLILKIKVAREIRKLMPSLKTQLDVTQLILVHSNPLSIAFRQDEKKFDVAGAYNIRYEITKKRIDKALVKGSNERITQVGKIAIIYSHAEEIEEYNRYIDYLIAKGFLKSGVEDFELEDLKGASGLRALRVEVNFDLTDAMEEINISEMKRVIQSN